MKTFNIKKEQSKGLIKTKVMKTNETNIKKNQPKVKSQIQGEKVKANKYDPLWWKNPSISTEEHLLSCSYLTEKEWKEIY